MSERKVLNKYYPPDFDPSKIPRARQSKNRQFTVRLMAPCNMRCNTCGEYIYKGKKFNARKEDVENDTYLGIRIYRFYIKCTRCLAEISFKTDPQSTDYIIEAGATRNFMALKLAEEQAEREEKAEKEDDATNPMKMLEKRTQASRDEMAVLEALEELKELNQRQVTPDYETMLNKYDFLRAQEAKRREDENEQFITSAIAEEEKVLIKRIYEEPDSDEDETSLGDNFKKPRFDVQNPTDILTGDGGSKTNGSKTVAFKEKEKSIGIMKINKQSLVRKKVVPPPPPQPCLASEPPPPKTVEKKGGNALSLLGDYGSDSNDSE